MTSSDVVVYKNGLDPAEPAEIAVRVNKLLRMYPDTKPLEKDTFQGYCIALQGEPLWAIEKAIKAFLSGKVERKNSEFVPSIEAFAKQVKSYTAHLKRAGASDEAVRRTQEKIKPLPPLTSGQRQRRREQVAEASSLNWEGHAPAAENFHADPQYRFFRHIAGAARKRLGLPDRKVVTKSVAKEG